MKCRILIIDSDEHSRIILTRRLTRRDFEVCTLITGGDVVSETTVVQPDVILMDCSVATPDAWETARLLKRNADTAHIPIVAISVLDLEWDQRQAMEAGCDVYLPKPINMEALGSVLARVSRAKCAPMDLA
jgi:DNA-binding response OmpR family regulator